MLQILAANVPSYLLTSNPFRDRDSARDSLNGVREGRGHIHRSLY